MERFNVVGNVMTQLQSATGVVISPRKPNSVVAM